ncbi:MAG: Shedu anti-phage system protein SduA domain-containing protein [bacterium]
MPTFVGAVYRDIVELKRPDEPVLIWDKDHKNYYFSAEVSRAIGQCHRYIDILYDAAKDGLLDHPEVVAYYPRAIIVIGRSSGWTEGQIRALHGLNYRLNAVVVMTYDQLLAQGERLVEMLGEQDTDEERDEPPQADDLQVFDAGEAF